MKLRKFLIIAVIAAVTFTSCKDNRRDQEEDDLLERDRMETQREGEIDEDNLTAQIQENENLRTFAANLDRYEISDELRRDPARTTEEIGEPETTTGEEDPMTEEDPRITGEQPADETLEPKNYTIFAPTDEAYESLSEDQRNEMMDTQNKEKNTASINYLMVEERLTEDQLKEKIENSNGTYTIRTRQGEDIIATLEGDDIVLSDAAGNQARITESDEDASDGVIHVIDKVLMPQDPTRNEAANKMRTPTESRTPNTGTNK